MAARALAASPSCVEINESAAVSGVLLLLTEEPFGLQEQADGQQRPEAGDQHGDLHSYRRNLFVFLNRHDG